MIKVLGILAAVAVSSTALAADAVQLVPPGPTVIVVTDGDTVKINGSGNMRLLGIDTPETFQPRCANERKLGLNAKYFLRALIDSGEPRYDISYKDEWGRTDRYGRQFVNLYVVVNDQTIDVDKLMVAKGYGLIYKPGSKAKQERINTWCPKGAD